MKKVLALVLAAMMVLSIAPLALAAAVSENNLVFGVSGTALTISASNEINLTADARPADKYDIYLLNSSETGTAAFFTKQMIKDAKIDVKVRGGAGALNKVEIKYDAAGYAYAQVSLIEPFVSTGSKDFEIVVTPVINRKNVKDEEITIIGTLKNYPGEIVDDTYEYSNFDEFRRVIEAKDYVKKIELEVDDILSIFTKLFNGKKYYAKATNKIKSEDEALFVEYPELDAVYYLTTIGLNSVGNYVKLNLDDKTLFVYDEDLNYLGTSADELPVTGKYFIASAELDIVEEEVDEVPVDEADEDGSNPNMGGNDAPVNVNDNPGTGC